jgi:copper chaperone NosL
MIARVAALTLVLCLCACARKLPEPVDPAPSDACTSCRMAVSDVHFAAEVVAPGEEPRFFDDIGCLAKWLEAATVPDGAMAFVADHRDGHWTRAGYAVYTRALHLATPMGSGIIAHTDAASRDLDPAAAGGRPLTPGDVFGATRIVAGPNDGR